MVHRQGAGQLSKGSGRHKARPARERQSVAPAPAAANLSASSTPGPAPSPAAASVGRPFVILTQDPVVADDRAEQLRSAGYEVAVFALARLTPVASDALAAALRRLGTYRVVVLPSPSAVRIVAAQMRSQRRVWPSQVAAGLVGAGSAEAFGAAFGAGLPRFRPAEPPADGSHLARTLLAIPGLAGARALVLHRPDGRGEAEGEWIDTLRQAGWIVDVVAAYRAQPEPTPPASFDVTLAALQARGGPVVWQVGSRAHFDTLESWLLTLDPALASWARAQLVEVPHPAVAGHAESLGFTNVRIADLERPLTERLQYTRPPGPAGLADRPDSRTPSRTGAAGTQGLSHSPSSAPTDLSTDPNKDSPAGAGSGKAASLPAGADIEDAVIRKAGPPAADAAKTAAEGPKPAADTAKSVADTAKSGGDAAKPSSDAAKPAAAGAKGNAAAAAPVSTAAQTAPSRPSPTSERRGGGLWALLLLVVVGVLAIAGWWFAQQRFLTLERENARRLQAADSRASQLEEQLRSLRDAQSQLVSRSATLEGRLAESASQQEQLQSLYDEIARSRGESALSEVEESVRLASQHLELTGNVKAALLALEAAQKRLGSHDEGEAIGLRRLVGQDIEKLRALPDVDIPRLAARLDEAIDRIDRMPLLADASQSSAAAPGAGPVDASATAGAAAGAAAQPEGGPAAGTTPAEPATALERLYASVIAATRRGFDAVRDEFRSLVTIRRIDQADGLLMSPDQKRQVRENLRLLLLNARLSLINKQQPLFRQDMDRAIASVKRLFDVENAEVKAAIATLELLRNQPLLVDLPSLSETVSAIRAARSQSETRS